MLHTCNLLTQSAAAAFRTTHPASQHKGVQSDPHPNAPGLTAITPQAPLPATTTAFATVAATTAGVVALGSTAAAATFGGYSSMLAFATAGVVATLLLTTPASNAAPATPATAQSAAAQSAAITQIAALRPQAFPANQPIDSTTLLPPTAPRSAASAQPASTQARFAPATFSATGFTPETSGTTRPVVSLAEIDVPEPATALTLLIATTAAIIARRRRPTPPKPAGT